MKKFILMLTLLFCIGCARLVIPTPNGDAVYTRLGDQTLSGVRASITHEGDVTIRFEGQKSTADALNQAINTIGNLATQVK